MNAWTRVYIIYMPHPYHRTMPAIDTSRICLSAHKTIEAGNENRLFTMDYIARLDFKLLFCVHSSKFGKCLLSIKSIVDLMLNLPRSSTFHLTLLSSISNPELAILCGGLLMHFPVIRV